MTIGGVFLLLAFAAGLVSFISPCVLPLVPGYVSAVVGADPAAQEGGRQALVVSLCFLAGFLAVFLALGASALGAALAAHRHDLNLAAGALVVGMGVIMVGDIALSGLGLGSAGGVVQRMAASGPAAMGVAFAFCWTPCIGSVLGSILVLAGAKLTLSQGVLLLLVYGLGLAIPFLLVSLGFTHAMRVSASCAATTAASRASRDSSWSAWACFWRPTDSTSSTFTPSTPSNASTSTGGRRCDRAADAGYEQRERRVSRALAWLQMVPPPRSITRDHRRHRALRLRADHGVSGACLYKKGPAVGRRRSSSSWVSARIGGVMSRVPWRVSDELWRLVVVVLPPPARRFRYPGRRRADDRACLEGIVFVLSQGIAWRALPREPGRPAGKTCWKRVDEWTRLGVWDRLQAVLIAELDRQGRRDSGARAGTRGRREVLHLLPQRSRFGTLPW